VEGSLREGEEARMNPSMQVQLREPPDKEQLVFGAPQPTLPHISLATRR
jgi:hypothetical protein